MPPRVLSRYSLSAAIDGNAKPGSLILTDPEPFRFRQRSDNRHHVVKEADTLFTLASRFFRGLSERPAGLWWVIAWYQPEPIHDPTVSPAVGSVLIIPSANLVREIFAETRRVD